MDKVTRITVVVILILIVGVAIAIKQHNKADSESRAARTVIENITINESPAVETEKVNEPKALPRLIDLGADKCIPCKMMAPILVELKREYAGVFNVNLIDVWKDPDAGSKFGIRIIPTQIFLDDSGKELFRHEGFFSKKDILAKWKQLGVRMDLAMPNGIDKKQD